MVQFEVDELPEPGLVVPSQVNAWPQGVDPLTRRAFSPSFMVQRSPGCWWTISTESDGDGHLAGSPRFNPAARPQWVLVSFPGMNDETAGAGTPSGS